MRRPPLAPLILAALAACSSDEAPPCEGPNGPCIELAPSGGDDHGALQTALIEAAPGDVIYLAAGTYEVSQGLSLAVDDVTLRGAGMDETVISFAGQVDGAQGLLVTADGFTAEDLAVMDTAGDGIKVEGGARVIVRRVRVEWSGTPSQDNG